MSSLEQQVTVGGGESIEPQRERRRRTLNVLLVGEQPENLTELAAALAPLGAQLVRASSADDAVRTLERDRFALVLIDVLLPGGTDGFALARQIQEREESRSIPIFFITNADRDYQAEIARFEASAVDALHRPIDPEMLRAKATIFLELFRLRHESEMTEELRSSNARLRRAMGELEDARLRAEEARLAKDRFLATMSHEIRTPINAILGYAQILELGVAGGLRKEQRAFLARLSTSGKHLLGLVNDVLDLAKVGAGEMQVSREPGLTGAPIAAALELSGGIAASRGVQLIDAKPGDPGVPYVGDEHRVRQIILNLISNAIKFTEPGGRVVVTCETREQTPPSTGLHGSGPWACIAVADTGVGIAPEHHQRIFEPFQQVEEGHTRSHGGTGLGLTISRQLARLMGGDLTVDSAPGRGATFTLWLPAAISTESAGVRGERAMPDPLVARVQGLGEFGEALREEVHGIMRSYAARLRSDPEIPHAKHLRQPDLDDHAVTFLADLAQSLIIVNEADAQAADLLTDATEIQRVIAQRHGRRRHRQGWSLESVRRDYAILREEIERAVSARIPASTADRERALLVVNGLTDLAEAISVRVWREGEQRGEG